ncbi:hypothetical protein Dimus_000357 [Dionaea muscipula]
MAKPCLDYVKTVINQLALDLKRMHDLGLPKIVVTTLQPIRCLPSVTVVSSYQSCNEYLNGLVRYHNQLLVQHVHELNAQVGKPVFFIFNLYDGFMSALKPDTVYTPVAGLTLNLDLMKDGSCRVVIFCHPCL